MKNAYQLSNVMSTLLPFLVFIAFAVFSVPGGLLAARIGKKKLLLLGLGINALALVIPSILTPSFPVLLACIFLLGVGTTFLQVAGNPIMRDVSAEGRYSRNLAFAQGIKGIGSTASTYLVTAVVTVALFKGMDWRGAFPLFCVLMALAFVSVAFVEGEGDQGRCAAQHRFEPWPAQGTCLPAGGRWASSSMSALSPPWAGSSSPPSWPSAWRSRPPTRSAPRCSSCC